MGLFKKNPKPLGIYSMLDYLATAENIQLDEEDNVVFKEGEAVGELRSPFLVLKAEPRKSLQGVVGEQHYTDNIYQALPGISAEELAAWSRRAKFELVAEPENAYDSNAVAVLLNGYHSGYLPREDAASVRDVLDGLAEMVVVRIVGDAVIGLGQNVDSGGPLFSVNLILPFKDWESDWEIGPRSQFLSR